MPVVWIRADEPTFMLPVTSMMMVDAKREDEEYMITFPFD